MKFFKVKSVSGMDFNFAFDKVQALLVEGNKFGVILKDNSGVEKVEGIYNISEVESFLTDHGFKKYDTIPTNIGENIGKSYIMISPGSIMGYTNDVPNSIDVLGEVVFVYVCGQPISIVVESFESFKADFNIEI